MWPFFDPPAAHAPMHEPELSDLMRKRLDDLVERQDRHERVLKDIRLEWDEMYDKFRLLYARVSKRIKDAANAGADGVEPSQDPPSSTNPRAVGYDRPFPLHGGPSPTRRNY